MKKILFIYICFISSFITSFAFANNKIATLNFEYIFNNTKSYNSFLITLNSYKKELENLINDRENNLIEMKNDLESLKLLATDDEINKTTISYNQKVQVLMKDIEIINNNMSLNLNNNQKILKKNIAQISQIIAEENSIELILDQNQYFITSSKIDISDKIIDILNDRVITFKLDKIK